MPKQSRSVLSAFDKLGTIVFPFHTYQQLAVCALAFQNCKDEFDSGLKMRDFLKPSTRPTCCNDYCRDPFGRVYRNELFEANSSAKESITLLFTKVHIHLKCPLL